MPACFAFGRHEAHLYRNQCLVARDIWNPCESGTKHSGFEHVVKRDKHLMLCSSITDASRCIQRWSLRSTYDVTLIIVTKWVAGKNYYVMKCKQNIFISFVLVDFFFFLTSGFISLILCNWWSLAKETVSPEMKLAEETHWTDVAVFSLWLWEFAASKPSFLQDGLHLSCTCFVSSQSSNSDSLSRSLAK